MSLRYKVPQNVQIEDKILWFITLRQLIIIMIGGGISYLLFVNVTKSYYVNSIQMGLIWSPAAVSAAIAFLKIKGMPLIQFVLCASEVMFFRARYRYWIAGGGTDHTSSVYAFAINKAKKKDEVVKVKEFDQNKMKNILEMIDNK